MKASIQVEPIVGTTFGAVVKGVSLASEEDLDATTFAQIEALFLEYGMLIFPNQNGLSTEAQTRFAARFGEVIHDIARRGDDHYIVTNRRKDGMLLAAESDARIGLTGNESWHYDHTFLPVENRASLLMALEVPSKGGGTGFADMRAAYADFSPATKEKLEKFSHAYHSAHYSSGVIGLFPKKIYHSGVELFGTEAPLRPLVKRHPLTGDPFFHAGRHAFGVVGMSPEQSEEWLAQLTEEACQPPRVYEHMWRVGDLVLWDQQRIMHRARPYDPKETRILRGTGILGDPRTEGAVTGTPEAERAEAVVTAELARLRARNTAKGTLPKAAL